MTGSATGEPAAGGAVADLTAELASALVGFKLADVPEDVAERARHIILDGLACGLVGAKLPWSRRAVAALHDLEGDGSSTLWGWARSLPPGAACLLNGSFVQAFELDDYHHVGPLHSASVVLPAALATAEHLGRYSAEQLILAVVLGFEIGPRLGAAMDGFDMIARGLHGGAIYGALAATAAAGIVRGLDADQLSSAFGIAGAQASGLMGAQYEAMVKGMQHGFAARNGLYAAALAAHGYTGMRDVLGREYGGLVSVFAPAKLDQLGAVMERLGEHWELATIAVKPYACMGGTHSTIDAVLELRAAHGITAADARSVTIRVPEAIYHHGGWQLRRPATVVGAQMNLAYAAAVALVDGAAGVAQFAPGRLDDDQLWDVIERVTVVRDDEVAESSEGRSTLAAHVEIATSSGVVSERVHAPRGSASSPLANGEIAEKARGLAERCVPPGHWADIEATVLALPQGPGVEHLIELLRPAVTEALRPDESAVGGATPGDAKES